MNRATGWYAVGAIAVIGAVAVAVIGAPLPSAAWLSEIGLFAFGAAYTALAVTRLSHLATHRQAWMWATTATNIALATAILTVAAPWIPYALPLSFAVLLSTILAAILGRRPSWSRPLLAIVISVAGLVAVWLRLRPQSGVRDLLVWAGLLAGFGILIEVHRRMGRAEVELRVRNLGIVATAAHQLGVAADATAVARAVLEAFKAGFPHLNWGGVLMQRHGELVSFPVSLSPAGVGDHADPTVPGGTLQTIRPGEGLAGRAFVTGEVMAWSSDEEFRREHHAMGESLAEYVDTNVGSIRSALAVPLCDARAEVVGVITLGSTECTHEWVEADFILARGLADQATVALQRSELTDEQRRQALTDHLTELPNRREFDRVLSERIPGQPYSILLADVDNLKLLNDEYGHEAGDRVLRVVSQVMRNGLRAVDTVARIGGDEFAAFLPATDMRTATEIAGRIVSALQGVASPFGAARISIGVADGAGDTPTHEVWDRADSALYAAKQAGRNRVQASLTTVETSPGSTRWGELLPSLLETRGIESVYQPIVSLDARRIIGYEALARRSGHLNSGVAGLFSAALRLGLGRDLDWLCRRMALDGARDLDDGTLLFINVGVPALVDPLHDIDQMLLLTSWAQRQPEEIVLELSEREAVTDRLRLREVLTAYRYYGFRFALDDVGEGHSTIEVLATARPEYIKIARALTRGPGHTIDGNLAAIAALVTFAEATGAQVIAEGVETDADIDLMDGLGVQFGQGYALGRPAPLPVPLPLAASASS